MTRSIALPVSLSTLLVLSLPACQPTAPGTQVTLSDGERCTIVTSTPEGRQLSCPVRGLVMAAPAATPDLGIELSDIPGVPNIPPIPQSQAEAECRAGQYAQNQVTGRVRGAVEGAVLEAAGLPGNTLGIWRQSQEIARRIEGRPAPEPAPDPCAGL